MICRTFSQLIAIKRWADRGLYDVVSQNFDRLTREEASIMLREGRSFCMFACMAPIIGAMLGPCSS
jgi:hypothetical protein